MRSVRQISGNSVLCVGVVAATGGTALDRMSVPHLVATIGFVVILLAAPRVLARRRDDAELIEIGRRLGYQRGYDDGRRIARPVVVEIRSREAQEARVRSSRR